MRNSWLYGALASMALCAPALAQQAIAPERASLGNSPVMNLEASEQRLADRLASDFFENELRLAQSRRIEAETAAQYLSLSAKERQAFREERRRIWRSFSHEQRLALRNVKVPAYNNLSEEQKQPFRRSALSSLNSTAYTPKSGAYGQDI